jgi:hypothetical protein
MVSDFTEMDFFRDDRLVGNPYPYFEALRQQCPVSRERNHGVTMVTGWDEAVEVFNDAKTFSSCISVTGPFPGFPVPLERDLDRTADIKISERAHGPANDRRYQYVPTYILRGLTELHLEFVLAQGSQVKVDR